MTHLPNLTSVKLLKVLARLGFARAHQKGSHIFMKHRDGRATTVPLHKGEDIGRGLLRKILRDIQMEPEEFRKIL